MPLEFNSINNMISSLANRRFQRNAKFVVQISRYSQAMRTALQVNGFTTRPFNELINTRVQTITIPEQNIFTADISGPGAFDYEHPYQYSLAKTVSMNLLNDQFDRLRNVFVDWIRVSSGIGSNGSLPYRSQTSCDFAVVALSDNGRPLSGYLIEDSIIKGVSGTPFDTSSNELVKFDVTLSCRRLRKLSGVDAGIALSGLFF